MLKETLKRNEGITLLALAVMVIALSIIAGISINELKGNNGIIKNHLIWWFFIFWLPSFDCTFLSPTGLNGKMFKLFELFIMVVGSILMARKNLTIK